MPRISEFYGIVVAMFYNDHEPPHFHAIYGEHRALVRIAPVELLRGDLPRRAMALVAEWAAAYHSERMEDWKRAREHAPLLPIKPLD